MSTHKICLYKEEDKKYTCCNLESTELHVLDCVLIGVLIGVYAVIRSSTVCFYGDEKFLVEKKKRCLFRSYEIS